MLAVWLYSEPFWVLCWSTRSARAILNKYMLIVQTLARKIPRLYRYINLLKCVLYFKEYFSR